jgi:hypothetical protein
LFGKTRHVRPATSRPEQLQFVDLAKPRVDARLMTNTASRGRMVTAFGDTKTIADWARDERCLVKYHCLYDRIVRAGWPAETAMRTSTHRSVVLLTSPSVRSRK